MICKTCGKTIKPQFERCYECNERYEETQRWLEYKSKSEDEKELELEMYYSRECVMCGKEGADERKDGQNYCSTCWTIWNS